MKILFTKLKTNASNITVKYDETGDVTRTYPVNEIRQNDNTIEFDSSFCADLDNIEISTGSSSAYKPTFDEDNDYDVLFEYLNGCKTGKWVIDQEHFPNTWKKLFGPDHVVHSYTIHTKGDTVNSEAFVGGYKLDSYSHFEGSYDVSDAQAILSQIPLAYDGKMYVSSINSYEEYDPEIDIGKRVYLYAQYRLSSTSDQFFILNEINYLNNTYTAIDCGGNFYLATVDNNGKIYTNKLIYLTYCSNYEEAQFLAYHQNYYFEYVGEGNGTYNIYNNSLGEYNYYYDNKYDSNDFNFVPTDLFETGLLDMDFNYDELLTLFDNPNNNRNNNNQSAYRVYVDGYDLMDDNNIELSRKLLFMLSTIQYYWRNNTLFPLISYSSFNDKTLLNYSKTEYDSWYGPQTLINCNSIVKLLGRRRICNLYDYWGSGENSYYLNNLKELDDDYINNTRNLYIYERNIKDNDILIENAIYNIIPSSKKLPIKKLRNDSGYGYIKFYKGINSPKNNYTIPYESMLYHMDSEDKELFTIQAPND